MTATPREPLEEALDWFECRGLLKLNPMHQEHISDSYGITLAAAYRKLLSQQQWRDIASAPKDGTRILIHGWRGATEFIVNGAWYSNGVGKGPDGTEWGNFRVTGCQNEILDIIGSAEVYDWLPLPPPPEEKGG